MINTNRYNWIWSSLGSSIIFKSAGTWSRAFKAGALGQLRGTGWGGRWEWGSGWENTCVPVADSCWYGKNHHNIVIILQLNKLINFKKEKNAEVLWQSLALNHRLMKRIEDGGQIEMFPIFLWLSVQFSLVAQSCMTFCDPMDCSTPGFLSITNSRSLLKLLCIESVMPSNHLILCHPLLLLPSIFPSIRVFSNESVLCISDYGFNSK